jgi:transcriptional regulator with XRE-family HTH domain
MSAFSESLKKLLKNSQLSQEQLAIYLDVSKSTISLWITDKTLPNIDKLKSISEYFSVSYDYLLGKQTLQTSYTKELESEILILKDKLNQIHNLSSD